MKKVDTAGMWTIKGNPITREGVYQYSGKAIDPTGSMGLAPDKLYSVFRPFEELAKAVESFNGKPLINNHEMIGTSEGLTLPDDKNIGGTIYNVRASSDQQGLIIADMTIYSKELQESIREGKVELSLGYYCQYRKEAGEYEGEKYDFVQCDLEGNHIALVENGRMGSSVRVFDSKTMVFDSMEIRTMSKKKVLDADELREEVKKLLAEASDEVLAKCKDILDPENGEDEDTAKKEGDEDDPKKEGDEDDPKKEGDEGEPKKEGDEGEGEGEPKKEGDEGEPKKEGAEDEDDPKKEGDEDEPKKEAGDSAPTMKEVLVEFSRREKLYEAVVPHTGAFDHDEMTTSEVAKYAAKKMGIVAQDGAEVACVENYLSGIAKATEKKEKTVVVDGAETGVSEISPSAKLKAFLG